jgi:hypothetical protein
MTEIILKTGPKFFSNTVMDPGIKEAKRSLSSIMTVYYTLGDTI